MNEILDISNKVLSKVDIVDVISRFISVKKQGRNYVAICPFHDDKNPSLSISKDKQIYKCFVCGEGGNAISFVKNFKKCSFIEAIKIVAEIAGISDIGIKEKQKTIDKDKANLLNCLNLISVYYENFLYQSDESKKVALPYLYNRGLTDELIKFFRLGYSPKNHQLITKNLQEKGYSNRILLKTGAFNSNEENIYDVNFGRLVFPISDFDGNIVGFSSRRLDDNNKTSKYINSPELQDGVFHKSTLLYNISNAKEYIKKSGFVYLVEGFMDVISLAKIGVMNSIALMGTAFTKDHLNQLRYLKCKVVLCLDSDNAGQTAMIKIGNILRTNQIDISVINNDKEINKKYINYKDCDEILNNLGKDNLLYYLNNQIDYIDYFINYCINNKDLDNINNKEIFIQEITKLTKNDIEFYSKLELISKVTNLPKNIIENIYKNKPINNNEQNTYSNSPQFVRNKVKRVLELPQKVLLYYMMDNYEAIEIFKDKNEEFCYKEYDSIKSYLYNYLDSLNGDNDKINKNYFINYLEIINNEETNNLIKIITEDLTNNQKLINLPKYDRVTFVDSLNTYIKERDNYFRKIKMKEAIKNCENESDKKIIINKVLDYNYQKAKINDK
ncbi:MAG: DNA primase [Bacillales bacterium]